MQKIKTAKIVNRQSAFPEQSVTKRSQPVEKRKRESSSGDTIRVDDLSSIYYTVGGMWSAPKMPSIIGYHDFECPLTGLSPPAEARPINLFPNSCTHSLIIHRHHTMAQVHSDPPHNKTLGFVKALPLR